MQKEIHVNSYVKRDGTHVKEHYRNIDVHESIMPEPQEDPWRIDENPDAEKDPKEMGPIYYFGGAPVLEGGIEVDVFPDELPIPTGGGEVIGTVISIALGVGLTAAKIAYEVYQAGEAANTALVSKLEPKLHTAVNKIENTLAQFEKMADNQLKQLVNTKDNQEYSKLLKSYTEQKAINQNMKQSVGRIKYAAEHKNYQAVYEELQNYQSDFEKVSKRIRQEQPLKKAEMPTINLYNSAPVSTPYMNNYLPQNQLSPQISKNIIDAGTTFTKLLHVMPDATELWRASSSDFKVSKGYINKNGNLVYSVSKLPSQELQKIVSDKLMEQLGVSDAPGIIFQPDSSISQAISNSAEMKSYFKQNLDKLLRKQIIQKGSTNFVSTSNLHNALGHADILYSYIDANGNFHSVIMDTYDFNKGESNLLVQWARAVQEAKLNRPYYTLSIIIIPISDWLNWLN